MWIRKLFCCGLVVVAVAMSGVVGVAADKAPSRILMLTQSKGFMHSSVKRPDGDEKKLAASEIAMIQLGQTSKLFTVDCTQDAAADFTKENLQNYDIVMFYTDRKSTRLNSSHQ